MRLTGFLLTMGAVAVVGTGLTAAEPNTNKPDMLLQQYHAMLSRKAGIVARVGCQDTIASTLRAIEQLKPDDPGMELAYCAPGEISATQGATLYVKYVNTHPQTGHVPAKRALILALKATNPCPDRIAHRPAPGPPAPADPALAAGR